jgi:hypothetical protein
MLKDQDPGCAMRFQRSGMDQQARMRRSVVGGS